MELTESLGMEMELVPTCNICQSVAIQKVDPSYNLCRCSGCGHVFNSPRPTHKAISGFYSKPTKYDSWIREEGARDVLWQRRVRKMIRHQSSGNLLDVGTGIGQFLYHARRHFSAIQGTEVSESAVRIARERYNLDIHLGQVEELNLPAASFDNVTLFHVLEHVPDPSKTLEEVSRIMRSKGILTIAVPNDVLAWTCIVKRFGRKLGLKSFRKFSPRLGISKAGLTSEIHLSHFTPTVLKRLLENCGFSIVEESLDPLYAASGAKLVLHSAYYFLHRALFACFGINRYEAVWIVSRKAP